MRLTGAVVGRRLKSRAWAALNIIVLAVCVVTSHWLPFDLGIVLPMYIFGGLVAALCAAVVVTGDTEHHKIQVAATPIWLVFLFFYSNPIFWFCEDRADDGPHCWHTELRIKNSYFGIFSAGVLVFVINFVFGCTAFAGGWLEERAQRA